MPDKKPVPSYLINTLHVQFPHLTDEELEMYVYQLEAIIADHLSEGDVLAFLRRKSDGSFDLTTYDLEALD